MRENQQRPTPAALIAAALSLFALFLLSPGAASAQWTQDANGNINNTNPGNVKVGGSGTAAPTSVLHTKGNLSSQLTGTVAVTQNSTTVTGTGTAFTTELSVGDSVKIGTSIFTVSAIASATSLTLDANYTGTTASGLSAFRDPGLLAVDNGAGASKLTVDKSGKVGIGTATPTSRLSIVETATTSSRGIGLIQYSSDTTPALLNMTKLRGVSGAPVSVVDGDTLATISANAYTGSYLATAGIHFMVNGTVSQSSAPTDIVFKAGNTGFGSERMRITSGGNVGIGTSSPGAALDVRGSIALDGTVPAAHAATNYSSLWLKNNVALIPEVAAGHSIINIGTNYQRTGSGWSYVDQNIPTWVLSMGGGPTWDQFQVSRSSGGAYNPVKLFVVNAAGYVGIGNPAPSVPLDVAGLVRSSSGGFVFPDGSTQATALSFGSTAGKAVQGNTTLTLTAGMGMSGGGPVTLGAGGTLTLTNNDRGSSQNIFKNVGNAAGATQFSAGTNTDTLSFEGTGGTTVSFDAGNRKVVINSNSSASSQWTTSGTTIYYNGGNVGIGTSTPLSGLTGNAGMELYTPSAVATFKIGTGLAGKNNAQVRFSGASGDNWAIGSDVATHNGSRDFHFYDFAGTPGARLTVQSATGRVGIGTSNPLTALHVLTTGSTKLQFLLQNSTATTQIETSLAGNSAQWNYGMDQTDGSKFKFSTDVSGNLAASVAMTLTQDGSVGIGTATPAAKLDVYGGYLHVSGVCGGALPNVQGAYLSWNQSCGTGETDLINHQGWGTGGFAFMNTANGSALTTLMSISGDAKVGIGKNNPTEALDVVGNIKATGSVSATYQDVAEWVPSSQKLTAGTVVVLDTERTNHVLASTTSYDTKVAGVVSASPGVILGVGGEDKLKIATTGRVRVKVDATRAPIRVGDLLVTGDTEGVAMKSIEVDLGGVKIHRPGTVIGKALEPLEKGTGEILVLLSLQ